VPKYKLAIEVDGNYHKICRVEDKERDKLCNSIGIRTIRISSKDVLRGDFIKSLKEKLTPKKHKKKNKKLNANKIK
jgi:very-short-patch-repair endonuclease